MLIDVRKQLIPSESTVMPFRLWAWTGPRNHVLDRGSRSPMRRGNSGGKGRSPVVKYTFCRELCRNSGTDRFAAWVADSGEPKEAQVQSYSPGGANVPTWECILAPPAEYYWTVRCGGDAVFCRITLTTCYYYCCCCCLCCCCSCYRCTNVRWRCVRAGGHLQSINILPCVRALPM